MANVAGRVVSGGAARAVLRAVFLGSVSAAAAVAADTPVATPRALLPAEALASIKVPEGFKVSLFAAEPDVLQPIALAFDTKGRLWVAECYSYPEWEKKSGPGKDRVVILEDTDGDGVFDRRKVFAEHVANVSGLELGFGGVWVCATPNLLFFADKDGDDRADDAGKVVLDGWDINARHNVFNGLTWGPDGWLWGCNGILSNSRVGAPGTPAGERAALNCGVWRYHPTLKAFEAVSHGTTNPWGLDFDDYGEAFITNCVIPHIYHAMPGAHMTRMFGQDSEPRSYELIPTIADHVHWDSAERWLDIRAIGVSQTTDAKGGGHAHSGAAVCLTDAWPASMRNTVLMGNIHGRRLNHDTLERTEAGSGYAARHRADFLKSGDPWFRTVAQKFGPDGALYVLDWSDTGECHEDDADGAHRENGRIFRVAPVGLKFQTLDLAAKSDVELARLQSSKNEPVVRLARRLLQEHAAGGADLAGAHAMLNVQLKAGADDPSRLRALWALHASGGIDVKGLTALLGDRSENLRAWAVRLIVDEETGPAARRTKPLPASTAERLAALAANDPSRRVGLALISALTWVKNPPPALAEALLRRDRDAADPVVSLMLWYGLKRGMEGNAAESARWAVGAKSPLVRRLAARQSAELEPDRALSSLVARLSAESDAEAVGPDATLDALTGLSEGLRGRRVKEPPAGWSKVAARAEASGRADLRERVLLLGAAFGDPAAVETLRNRLADRAVPAEARLAALDALVGVRAPGLARVIVSLLDDPGLRASALLGLAAFDDPETPAELLRRFRSFPEADRDAAVQTLASRPKWALALLDALGSGALNRRDLSSTVARQLRALGDKDVTAALERHWGTVRETSSQKAELTAKYKAMLSPEALKGADPARGRMVFQRTCQSCHRLYGEGGDIGPELTGSDRSNLDYLLLNVLDPNASVAGDYKVVNVATVDGRLVSGILREQTPAALVVRTVNGVVVVPRSEAEEVRASELSMMPEGLFERLTDAEIRDLAAYLAAKAQVPLPAH